MKNVIVQIFMDKKGWEEENRLDAQSEQVLFLSNVLVKHYAKKINSDYKLITKPIINFKHPTWERFQLFDDQWINNYDNILYLDTDVFTWPEAPNIFELLDNTAFNIVKHCNNKTYNGHPMFNAGVFAINKTCAVEMKKFIKKENWLKRFEIDPTWEDSKELNTIFQTANIKSNWLEVKWNMKNDPDAFFTHMWGNQKKLFPNMPAIIKAKNCVKKIMELQKI